MKNLIACCGIDCETCDARIATVANDDVLREETAAKWTEWYKTDIASADINCMGCRTEGAKVAHCSMCEIRKCAAERGFSTCGECSEVESCQKIASILENVPGTKENLLQG